MERMRIAVIGTGNIGGTLGERWRAAGHDVTYGSRSAGKPGPGGSAVVSVADALAGAEVVLLAVPGPAVSEVISANGAGLAGKVVIDAVNRRGEDALNSRADLEANAPGARYVRAFNTLGWENFADPLAGTQLFFAADPQARDAAEELIRVLGIEPVYLGDADAQAAVDGLMWLWFAVMQRSGNRKVAFRMIS
jgi:8-hydroxy-5-deazaflavin:NADPH oxidoreductase